MLAHTPKHFSISTKLQENICLLAQSQVFEDGQELLETTMGIKISAKQIQRISESYGKDLEKDIEKLIKNESWLKESKSDKLTYIMPDGSMIYTREEGWKEIKVGRIFHAEDVIKIQENRSHITDSLYVCHVGEHKRFFDKMELYSECYRKKICVADGAKWIWSWATDTYPEMIQILDFFHAMEKLGGYASLQYKDDPKKQTKWMECQKQLLLSDKVVQVIKNIKLQLPGNKDALKAKEQLLCYYKNNQIRMMYGTYKKKGYIIGSGAIESAHRNVVQQRLKLSGQRWSINGAQYIVNLRAHKKSNRWPEVVDLIKQAA